MDKKQRDALALAAMQGMLANGGLTQGREMLATEAYGIADAMLEESERTCPACGAVRVHHDKPLIHISGCEFGWPDAPLPGEKT